MDEKIKFLKVKPLGEIGKTLIVFIDKDIKKILSLETDEEFKMYVYKKTEKAPAKLICVPIKFEYQIDLTNVPDRIDVKLFRNINSTLVIFLDKDIRTLLKLSKSDEIELRAFEERIEIEVL